MSRSEDLARRFREGDQATIRELAEQLMPMMTRIARVYAASEDDVDEWAERTGRPRGRAVPIEVLFELSGPWYRDRLDPDRVPATSAERQRLLDAVGLTGEFWRLR